MAISYINTSEVEDISKEIISLSNDLNDEFVNLFTRLSEVPTISKEWVGEQAEFYFKRVSFDKKNYIDFVNCLRNIGYILSKNVYYVQNCINENINEESSK